jgi:hypothetical protein
MSSVQCICAMTLLQTQLHPPVVNRLKLRDSVAPSLWCVNGSRTKIYYERVLCSLMFVMGLIMDRCSQGLCRAMSRRTRPSTWGHWRSSWRRTLPSSITLFHPACLPSAPQIQTCVNGWICHSEDLCSSLSIWLPVTQRRALRHMLDRCRQRTFLPFSEVQVEL